MTDSEEKYDHLDPYEGNPFFPLSAAQLGAIMTYYNDHEGWGVFDFLGRGRARDKYFQRVVAGCKAYFERGEIDASVVGMVDPARGPLPPVATTYTRIQEVYKAFLQLPRKKRLPLIAHIEVLAEDPVAWAWQSARWNSHDKVVHYDTHSHGIPKLRNVAAIEVGYAVIEEIDRIVYDSRIHIFNSNPKTPVSEIMGPHSLLVVVKPSIASMYQRFVNENAPRWPFLAEEQYNIVVDIVDGEVNIQASRPLRLFFTGAVDDYEVAIPQI